METYPADLMLYVLAGGGSTRFGSDKAFAIHDGLPLICSVIEALSPAVNGTVVVADQVERFAKISAPIIVDRRPGQGPLAGLESALMHRTDTAGQGWIALAACDLVDPDPAWLSKLSAQTANDAQAVAYHGLSWEPLMAIYHTSVLPILIEHLDRGARSMQHLLDHIVTVKVGLPAGMTQLPQANTPAALASYQSLKKEAT